MDRDGPADTPPAAVVGRVEMAKGQVRSNKETRKPKADKKTKVDAAAMTVPGKFAAPQKDSGKK
ncbi:hypothetical protein [Aureimonas sp. AU12]|uniref:hypothetical protein n=1 Tax=Aureimonas sp. AU12 TaxID=1638161 RepID=UPI0012E3DDDD|nr:hypothetical protein [Aureimonas sp. AU12]